MFHRVEDSTTLYGSNRVGYKVNFSDIATSAAGVLLIGFLVWFFFGPKKARQAGLDGQVQQAQVLIKGGYAPNRIRYAATPGARLATRSTSGSATSYAVAPPLSHAEQLQRSKRRYLEKLKPSIFGGLQSILLLQRPIS